MKRSYRQGERFDTREMSNAAFTASMFAASVGMIWDLATGHVSAFDRILSNISEDDCEIVAGPMARSPARSMRGGSSNA
jgi:hypothetical protein